MTDNIIPIETAKSYHQALMSNLKYLAAIQEQQGFNLDTIKGYMIGFDSVSKRITFAIINEGICYNIKKYNSKLSPKYLNSPGSKKILWGVDTMLESVQVLICAGEKDRLHAIQNGFTAVSCTTGEGNWDNSWNELFKDKEAIIIYDNDEAGRNGALKVAESLKGICRIKIIDLSVVCIEDKEDLQDYFHKYKKTAVDLQQLIDSTDYQELLVKPEQELKDSIVLTEQQKADLFGVFQGVQGKINNNFPELWPVIKICMSILLQLRIADITNPFSLMLVGQPSGSKTTPIDIFKELDLAYYADSFTPAAFVSNNASRSEEQLQKIDMLPKLKGKALLTPELSTIFSKDGDQLLNTFGILTRVLDGQGYTTNTGAHGQRGYEGDFMFVWLGATTPIKQKIWEIMGNMGARIFFYNITGIIDDDDTEGIYKMLHGSKSYSEKMKDSRITIKKYFEHIYSLPIIKWNVDQNEKMAIKRIIQYAQLLAKLRAVISQHKDDEGNIEATAMQEKPLRLSVLLANLAKGHALLCARDYISWDDIPVIHEVAINSCPPKRMQLIKGLIAHNGRLSTKDIQSILDSSDKPALNYMRQFEKLGICRLEIGIGSMPSAIEFQEKFKWLIESPPGGQKTPDKLNDQENLLGVVPGGRIAENNTPDWMEDDKWTE
ncbi:MAG TPA: hypothetical protein DF296_05935 [Candidatus Margulisbacteria bacterium]|nr:MAG: hypothetical protein A2X42_04080 [Candidatus Margulisbacteria bacterium GWF2_38_17]OGI07163.1 MAG: hypothetical protein A2X41_06150 [Candidatus Margulisbacteria bacterium GWE2_39_32]HCT84722.1 hypothetical protein [Candidatus Margulisiibacteriota bacterium]